MEIIKLSFLERLQKLGYSHSELTPKLVYDFLFDYHVTKHNEIHYLTINFRNLKNLFVDFHNELNYFLTLIERANKIAKRYKIQPHTIMIDDVSFKITSWFPESLTFIYTDKKRKEMWSWHLSEIDKVLDVDGNEIDFFEE